jgi:hypothetical protein
MPHATSDFTPCGQDEVVLRAFNFAPGLGVGEALIGTPTCSLSVDIGVDSTPQTRLLGGPSVSGTNVNILIGTMQPGVTYIVLVVVQTSFGQTLDCWAYQSCYPP